MNALNDYAIARIIDKRQESPDIFTYRLRFDDDKVAEAFSFAGGQFNMLYIFGVGEVPISIVSDPEDTHILDHTIRIVGRVTRVIGEMQPGDTIAVRGPFGAGWPLELARGKDVVVITGGLGCAPVVGAVEYLFRRRMRYGAIKILHGVKTPRDLLYQERFEAWRLHPDTEVLPLTDEVSRLVVAEQSAEAIKSLARKQGMTTLRESGVRKVITGETALEEVYRVTMPDQDIGLILEP